MLQIVICIIRYRLSACHRSIYGRVVSLHVMFPQEMDRQQEEIQRSFEALEAKSVKPTGALENFDCEHIHRDHWNSSSSRKQLEVNPTYPFGSHFNLHPAFAWVEHGATYWASHVFDIQGLARATSKPKVGWSPDLLSRIYFALQGKDREICCSMFNDFVECGI